MTSLLYGSKTPCPPSHPSLQTALFIHSPLPPSLQALRNVKDGLEKEHAFHGLCALLSRQTSAGSLAPGPSFGALAGAMVSWRNIRNPVLQQEVRQVGDGGRSLTRQLVPPLAHLSLVGGSRCIVCLCFYGSFLSCLCGGGADRMEG